MYLKIDKKRHELVVSGRYVLCTPFDHRLLTIVTVHLPLRMHCFVNQRFLRYPPFSLRAASCPPPEADNGATVGRVNLSQTCNCRIDVPWLVVRLGQVSCDLDRPLARQDAPPRRREDDASRGNTRATEARASKPTNTKTSDDAARSEDDLPECSCTV